MQLCDVGQSLMQRLETCGVQGWMYVQYHEADELGLFLSGIGVESCQRIRRPFLYFTGAHYPFRARRGHHDWSSR